LKNSSKTYTASWVPSGEKVSGELITVVYDIASHLTRCHHSMLAFNNNLVIDCCFSS